MVGFGLEAHDMDQAAARVGWKQMKAGRGLERRGKGMLWRSEGKEDQGSGATCSGLNCWPMSGEVGAPFAVMGT